MKQIAFNQLSQSAVYREAEVTVSLTVCGGTYGGGSEVLVICSTSKPSEPYVPQTISGCSKNK